MSLKSSQSKIICKLNIFAQARFEVASMRWPGILAWRRPVKDTHANYHFTGLAYLPIRPHAHPVGPFGLLEICVNHVKADCDA
jgi:hypothetical protein